MRQFFMIICVAANTVMVKQWSLTYPDYSLIGTHVWEPIRIPQQKVPHLSGQSGGVRISEARL